MFAVPISPLVENLTPSFVTEITTAKAEFQASNFTNLNATPPTPNIT